MAKRKETERVEEPEVPHYLIVNKGGGALLSYDPQQGAVWTNSRDTKKFTSAVCVPKEIAVMIMKDLIYSGLVMDDECSLTECYPSDGKLANEDACVRVGIKRWVQYN